MSSNSKKWCYLSGSIIRFVIMITENELILWSWSIVVKDMFKRDDHDYRKWTKSKIVIIDFYNLSVWALIMIIENELNLQSWSECIKCMYVRADSDHWKWTKFKTVIIDFCKISMSHDCDHKE